MPSEVGRLPRLYECSYIGFNVAPFLPTVSGSTEIAVGTGGTIDSNGDSFHPLRNKPHWPAEWPSGRGKPARESGYDLSTRACGGRGIRPKPR